MKIVVPGEPVPKGRPRINKTTGTVYTPATTRVYENSVAMMAMVGKEKFADAPVIIEALFFLKGNKKVDIDNLVKSVLDGLNHSGIWDDDSQVWALAAFKYPNAETPRTEITIGLLGDQPS